MKLKARVRRGGGKAALADVRPLMPAPSCSKRHRIIAGGLFQYLTPVSRRQDPSLAAQRRSSHRVLIGRLWDASWPPECTRRLQQKFRDRIPKLTTLGAAASLHLHVADRILHWSIPSPATCFHSLQTLLRPFKPDALRTQWRRYGSPHQAQATAHALERATAEADQARN